MIQRPILKTALTVEQKNDLVLESIYETNNEIKKLFKTINSGTKEQSMKGDITVG